MHKTFSFLSLFLVLMVATVQISCHKEDDNSPDPQESNNDTAKIEPHCYEDYADRLVVKSKEFKISDSITETITVYPVMTPTNYPFCTYRIDTSGVTPRYVTDECEPNIDTVYNEVSAGYNDIFGVDYNPKVFKANGFFVSVKVSPDHCDCFVWHSGYRYTYAYIGNVFMGLPDCWPDVTNEPCPAGIYKYSLFIYDLIPQRDTMDDVEYLQALEDFDYYWSYADRRDFIENNDPVDSIVGDFLILRQKLGCDLSFLEAMDPGDGMLQ